MPRQINPKHLEHTLTSLFDHDRMRRVIFMATAHESQCNAKMRPNQSANIENGLLKQNGNH